MRYSRLTILIVVLCLATGCKGKPESSLTLLSNPTTTTLYETSEIAILFDAAVAITDPYNKKEIRAECAVQDGTGTIETLPAFFTTPYQFSLRNGIEIASVSGHPCWMVRFTPKLVGDYKWSFKLTHLGKVYVLKGRFVCVKGDKKGFVTASKADPRFLEFSDNTFFYPVGHVIRSPSDHRWAKKLRNRMQAVNASESAGVFAYETRFKNMSENGENFCSIWLSPWWCGLEWSPVYEGYEGLGRYNQINAGRVDEIIKLAESYGIYLIVYLTNHGQFSTHVDAEWYESPYRKSSVDEAVQYPSDFFRSESCLRIHENFLEYAIARWGASTAIACWGICTETEWVEPWSGERCLKPETDIRTGHGRSPIIIDADQDLVIRWLKRASDHIQFCDKYSHLVSTQFAYPESWDLCRDDEDMQVILSNGYTNQIRSKSWASNYMSGNTGVVNAIHATTEYLSQETLPKPVLLAEWGGSPIENTPSRLRVELHAGLWATAVSRASGITGFWWWHAIETDNLYPEFRAVSRFVADIDRRGKKFSSQQVDVLWKACNFPSAIADGFCFGHPRFRCLALFDDREMYAYLFAYEFNNQNSLDEVQATNPQKFRSDDNCYIRIPAQLQNGTYKLELWETTTGTTIEEKIILIEDEGSRLLKINMNRPDCAVKLRLNQPLSR